MDWARLKKDHQDHTKTTLFFGHWQESGTEVDLDDVTTKRHRGRLKMTGRRTIKSEMSQLKAHGEAYESWTKTGRSDEPLLLPYMPFGEIGSK